MDPTLQPYANAIASIESGGEKNPYGALGPVMPSGSYAGDRAYGKYQVMGKDVPAWTKQATGTSMTPQQFLQSPDAQDAVFSDQFGRSLKQYGNPQDAASVWFSGRPLAKAGNASDGYLTTPQYVDRFTKALGGQTGALSAPPQQPTGGSMPDPTQGALSPPAMNPDAALYGSAGWAGSGGIGNTLQNVGGWLMARDNPAGGAALIGQANAQRARQQQMELQLRLGLKPQPFDMGNDLLGQKRMPMLWDPMSQTMRPMNIQGGNVQGGGQGYNPQGGPTQSSSISPSPTFSDDLQAHAAGKITDAQLRASAGGAVTEEADALLNGTQNPHNYGARNPGLRAGGLLLAHALDPNFNDNQIEARQKFTTGLASAASGTPGGAIANSARIVQLGSDMRDALDAYKKLAWGGGDQPDAAAVQSFLANHSMDPTVRTAVNNVNSIADQISDESARLANGGKPSLGLQEQYRSRLDLTKLGPTAVEGGLRTLMKTMHDNAQPYIDNGNTAFGRTGANAKTIEDYWSDKTKGSLARVMSTTPTGDGNAPPPQQTPPGNTPAVAPTMPKVGEMRRGWVYKGGNPADPASWEQ